MIIFQESSKLNRYLAFSIFFFLIPISSVFYKKASNELLLFIIVVLLVVIVGVILLSTKLDLLIYEDKITFKFYPFKIKGETILFTNIDKMEISKVDPIGDYGGWGFRKSKKGKAYITSSSEGLLLIKNDGSSIFFSVDQTKKLIAVIDQFNFYKQSIVGS